MWVLVPSERSRDRWCKLLQARTAVQKVVIRQGSSPKTGERQYMVVLHTTVRPAANPKPRKEVGL